MSVLAYSVALGDTPYATRVGSVQTRTAVFSFPPPLRVAAAFAGGVEVMAAAISLTVITTTDLAVAASFAGGAEAMAAPVKSLVASQVDRSIDMVITVGSASATETILYNDGTGNGDASGSFTGDRLLATPEGVEGQIRRVYYSPSLGQFRLNRGQPPGETSFFSFTDEDEASGALYQRYVVLERGSLTDGSFVAGGDRAEWQISTTDVFSVGSGYINFKADAANFPDERAILERIAAGDIVRLRIKDYTAGGTFNSLLTVAAAFAGGTEVMTSPVSTSAVTLADLSTEASFAGGAEVMASPVSTSAVSSTDLSAVASFAGGAETMAATLSTSAVSSTTLDVAASFAGGAEAMAATVQAVAVSTDGVLGFALASGTTTLGTDASIVQDTTANPEVTYLTPNPWTTGDVRAEISHDRGITAYKWQSSNDAGSTWVNINKAGSDTLWLNSTDPGHDNNLIRLSWTRNGSFESADSSVTMTERVWDMETDYPVPSDAAVPATAQVPTNTAWLVLRANKPSNTDGYVYQSNGGNWTNTGFYGQTINYSFATAAVSTHHDASFGDLAETDDVELSDTHKSWVRRAFDIWSHWTNAQWTEVADGSGAPVRIGYSNNEVGVDYTAFVNSGSGAVAIRDNGNFNIRVGVVTALHEIGHLYGLAHLNQSITLRGIYTDSIMESGAAGGNDNTLEAGEEQQLTDGDILGVWHMAGSGSGASPIRPDACRGLSQSNPASGEATVSWNAPLLTGGRAVTEYRVQCGSRVIYIPAGTLTHTFTDLAAGSYEWFVRAANSEGLGLHSDHKNVNVTTLGPPAQVSQPTVSAGVQQIDVSWSAPFDNWSAITGYEVQCWAYASGGTTVVSNTSTGTETTATITGLQSGIAHVVFVRAINAEGEGVWSAPSGTATPTAPSPLQVVASFSGGAETMTAPVQTWILLTGAGTTSDPYSGTVSEFATARNIKPFLNATVEALTAYAVFVGFVGSGGNPFVATQPATYQNLVFAAEFDVTSSTGQATISLTSDNSDQDLDLYGAVVDGTTISDTDSSTSSTNDDEEIQVTIDVAAGDDTLRIVIVAFDGWGTGMPAGMDPAPTLRIVIA